MSTVEENFVGTGPAAGASGRCVMASEMARAGKYPEARDALGGLWPGVGARPAAGGLSEEAAAELLFCCGVLTGRLGAASGAPDAQEQAGGLLTEALRKFESQGRRDRAAEALYELGGCDFRRGDYGAARTRFEAAALLLEGASDVRLAARVKQALAGVFLVGGEYGDAARAAAEAAEMFEVAGERAQAVRALVECGASRARAGEHDESIESFRRALAAACEWGERMEAGRAALSMIEEHGAERMGDAELSETFRRADALLADATEAGDLARLRACARVVAGRLPRARPGEKNFTLRRAVLEYEAEFIEQALREAGGSVTQAAKSLGLGHQALTEILKGRHKDLQRFRTPPASRRRPDAAERVWRGAEAPAAPRGFRALSILIVEDHPAVAEAVRETLEAEGWRVRLRGDGASALREMEGGERYDALVFDHRLSDNVSGIELIRYARALPHRRRTPVIMLSACDVEAEAWRAGTSAYLTKPQGIRRLADMITRLTARPV